MARLPRLTLAGYPHHVLQRGNNRQWVCVDDADRQQLLLLLAQLAPAHGVALHAYVLMDDHFHLLLTPETAQGLPKMMQALGRAYVRYFNQRHGRSGTLWEGRYRSTVIDPQADLLTCMSYLDLNPVRKGIVARAQDYAWSSHGHYAGQRQDKTLMPPAAFWSMGNTPFAREQAYADMVESGLTIKQQQALTSSVLTGWVSGSPAFVKALEKISPRRLQRGQRGRPALKAHPNTAGKT